MIFALSILHFQIQFIAAIWASLENRKTHFILFLIFKRNYFNVFSTCAHSFEMASLLNRRKCWDKTATNFYLFMYVWNTTIWCLGKSWISWSGGSVETFHLHPNITVLYKIWWFLLLPKYESSCSNLTEFVRSCSNLPRCCYFSQIWQKLFWVILVSKKYMH